ncbi:hypothetical protein [Acetatifactor aquisgranensis]|uniref:hypothetical protein n=1 Tax=Acetatifactor aquisgranensis TaxID=2941233 RepID=UPI002040506F|nr:hypothetical protein [Acetatifactor aquisgranensis]
MAQIELLLEKQLLTIRNQEVISSGDIDYDTCSFAFDESWDGFTKTGVFYQDKKNVQYAVLGADGSCRIPAQAMAGEGNMYIGVFGVSGSKVVTSTVERVYIRQGAISVGTVSTEPSDDVFLAIIAQYQRMAEMMQGYDATAAELSEMLRDLNAYDVADVLMRLEVAEAAVRNIELASGGLRFGMDADGNWGYIIPGSEDVIGFGAGRADVPGETLETYRWQTVECSAEFIEGDREWNVDVSDGNPVGKKNLFLAVKVPEACKTIMHLTKGENCALFVCVNDEFIVENTKSEKYDVQKILPLVKGGNYVFLECWRISSSGNNNVRISFAPIVV